MSMSLHSEKSRWYAREAASPRDSKAANLAFSLSRRENSLHGTLQTAGRQDDRYETRSVTSRSSFQNF